MALRHLVSSVIGRGVGQGHGLPADRTPRPHEPAQELREFVNDFLICNRSLWSRLVGTVAVHRKSSSRLESRLAAKSGGPTR
jgi:hypothetical protein